MHIKKPLRWYAYIGLFFASVSLFVFQVVITRLFSAMMQYHYVFLLTSMAIFGLGLGGMITFYVRRSHSAEWLQDKLSGFLMVLSLSYIGVFFLIFKPPFINFILLYAILAMIPYVFGGMILSAIFCLLPEQSFKLYFVDLTGSALGSLGVIYLLNGIGMLNSVLVIAAFAGLASCCMAVSAVNKPRMAAALGLLLTLGILITAQAPIHRFGAAFTGYLTSPNTSLARMRAANIDHNLADWRWDAYARTDLIEDNSRLDYKILSMDGGANSRMLAFDKEINAYDHLKQDLNYLPFAVGNQERVLLIGPGGGKDVVLALLAESGTLDAVEINAGSVALVREYGAYNGFIYDRENVNVYIQDGRNFVKSTPYLYDTIYLAQVMTGTAETIGYALAENYIYTKEAIRDYWAALKDEGRIAFIMHDEKDLTRITFTILESLNEIGIPIEEIGSHISVVNRRVAGHSGAMPIHMPLVMVQKTPYTQEQAEMMLELAGRYNHIPLHIPGIAMENAIGAYSMGLLDLEAVYQQFPYNIFPTTDNRPFFFDYQRSISRVLFFLLLGTLAVSLVFVKPLVQNKKLKQAPLYFVGLGVGFMLIEIPLIQKFALILGHPTRAFTTILAAILISSGLGSLFGGWRKFTLRGRYLPLLMVPLLTLPIYLLTLRFMNEWFIPSLAYRTLITFLLLFPLGFFMGMNFPYGISRFKASGNEDSIPILWGINGIMSVMGSILAVVLSMKLGFSYALTAGGIVYLVLFVFMPLRILKDADL